ncbi:MAG: DUF4399 domain-containing protein [Candidatus Eutrophobiaceae bacterium]
MFRFPCCIFLGCFALSFAAFAGQAQAPADAELYFIAPADGERIKGSVRVIMGLRGMGVAPAGVQAANTGHHHLIINAPLPDFNRPVPSDDNHRHFGGGQTEVILTLPAGRHTLQLLLGDHAHRPHTPPLHSDQIVITVLEE